jgi:hypothetical protein
MSNFITTAFVQQYTTNVAMLLQQQGSRLRDAVNVQNFTGKAASVVEQFGAATPVKNLARGSDTPLIGVQQDRRWVYPVDYDWGDLIDNQDKLRMIIDPTSPIAMAGAMAMGRAQDDAILAGIFGVNMTGELGNNSVSGIHAFNSGAQLVSKDVGGASTGLNIAKLRAAKKMLMKAEVDIDNDQLFMILTADDHDSLLNEAQAVSLDYNTKPVLVDGKITSFMGFNFIHSERVPGAIRADGSMPTVSTGSRYLPFWAKSGVTLGIWNDVQTQVTPRPDKRYATQIYVTGTFGATRTEELRVGAINVA